MHAVVVNIFVVAAALQVKVVKDSRLLHFLGKIFVVQCVFNHENSPPPPSAIRYYSQVNKPPNLRVSTCFSWPPLSLYYSHCWSACTRANACTNRFLCMYCVLFLCDVPGQYTKMS